MHVRQSVRTFLSAAFLVALSFAPQSLATELLPIETFFETEGVRGMELSPDGNKIALLAPNNGRYSLAMLDTTTGKAGVIVRFDDENIRSFFWKGNDRLLFYAAIEGHEIPLLASVDLAGKSVKRILEPRLREDDFSIHSGRLVDRLPSDDENVLIYSFAGDVNNIPSNINGGSLPRGSAPGVYKANINTARRSLLMGFEAGAGVSEGFFTADGQQRFTGIVEGTKVRFVIRARNDQPWQTIRTFPVTSIDWNVLRVMADGRTAYLIDTAAGQFGALRSLDLDTAKVSEPLFAPDAGEITGLITTSRRERLLGVNYEDTRSRTHWIDPQWEKISGTLEKNFPDQVVAIVSISEDEKRFLFVVRSDRDPGRYYLGDLRGDSMRVQLINAVRPKIKPEQMSPMDPIKFVARDGLTIHGYLTKPGGKVGPDTPLLIMPHGGPFGPRDSWGFNPEVQFLANRGYAILQVNYRGSGGYGSQFERAGYGEWGGKMQDDLTDAVEWSIKEGYANRDRIGIIGASYGGYAALAGVTLTPELYKVGINYVGVSDLQLITRWDSLQSAASAAVRTQQIGRDTAVLKQRSPVNHVANIRVPTLHAYGRNDPRVTIENWTYLEAALKKHGKTYESIVVKNEGHGFEKPETSIPFYRTVEAFLGKYLPTGPTKTDAVASTPAAAPGKN